MEIEHRWGWEVHTWEELLEEQKVHKEQKVGRREVHKKWMMVYMGEV